MSEETNYVEQARPGVLRWLEAVRWPDEGWGRWKYNSAMRRPYGLQSSGMALSILHDLGELDKISPQQKQEAAAFIQSCQDPKDGYFKDPLISEADHKGKHSWEEIWNQSSGVSERLRLLGAKPLYPLPTKRFVDLDAVDVREWIMSLDWTQPWNHSEIVSRTINGYVDGLPAGQRTNAVTDRAFEVYEQELLDPETGFPLKGGCKSRSVAMAGLFKIMFSYLYVERPVPYAQQAIDSTLALQSENGDFGTDSNMCINWDSLWVLRELNKQLNGSHRFEDIRAAGNKMAQRLLEHYVKDDGGFAFYGSYGQSNHHSIELSEPRLPIGDILGTHFSMNCLQYADEWNRA